LLGSERIGEDDGSGGYGRKRILLKVDWLGRKEERSEKEAMRRALVALPHLYNVKSII
jgi:hypothetical protein